ncbi:VOC family protein [Paenibacillus sp. DMB5]|uniref:VOC family protein n=1 Tax=Paenibacillus sp. DMB5 TaxID=1780103 RepID=UPI001F51C4CD|nr:VOC family protein [Paenibacillus sp. DMB5]
MDLFNEEREKKMKPIIDHIQITVKDIRVAEAFYDKFLPLLGYDIQNKASIAISEHDFIVVEYLHPSLAFGITSPRAAFQNEEIHRRKPGSLHHLAFKAETRKEVDDIYLSLVEIGAIIVEQPRLYPEYAPDYYAVFFKDLEGIKYEVVCR